ncbi:MAG: Rrf2 family transcriptional regulator [Elusimicrobia bacterium]|nr:Rrf2 family transcriptional regulator [Elusimicrobiota bacterium]
MSADNGDIDARAPRPLEALRLIRLSSSARYAIEGLVQLARSSRPLVDVRELARAGALPANFLAKILQRLAQAGLLVSRRGPGGGYALARQAAGVTLAEIVAAAERGERREHRCLLGHGACGEKPCALHGSVTEADGVLSRTFAGLTLAQLAFPPEPRR